MEVCPVDLKTISGTGKCQDPCQASNKECCCENPTLHVFSHCKCIPICTVCDGRNKKEVTCPADTGKECCENKCLNAHDRFCNVP
jgi:hypothetical protein